MKISKKTMYAEILHENFHQNLELVDKLNEFAKVKGVSSSELVLAGVMAQGQDVFPIPG